MPLPTPRAVITRSSDAAAPRTIFYLAPSTLIRGNLDRATTTAQHWERVPDWAELKRRAERNPPDALVLDATLINRASDADRAWLRRQFDDGVIVVSTGATSAELAAALSTPTLRDADESELPNPTLSYILVYELVQGLPDDIGKLERTYPEASATRRSGNVKGQAQGISGRSIGRLDNSSELSALFMQLDLAISSVRAARANFDPVQANMPQYEISTPKAGDRVEYALDGDTARFDVYSESGIGSAAITRTGGLAPAKTILRFHLRALEQLTLHLAGNDVLIRVPTTGDHAPTQSVPPASPLYSTVTVVSAGDAYPIEDGYIQVELPELVRERDVRTIAFEWIDFFR